MLAGTPGVPDAVSGLVVDLPWDDADGVERALNGRERDVAAIIIEPVQGAGGDPRGRPRVPALPARATPIGSGPS